MSMVICFFLFILYRDSIRYMLTVPRFTWGFSVWVRTKYLLMQLMEILGNSAAGTTIWETSTIFPLRTINCIFRENVAMNESAAVRSSISKELRGVTYTLLISMAMLWLMYIEEITLIGIIQTRLLV